MADVNSILSKLYSGSTLTAEEKYAIGIGPAPTSGLTQEQINTATAKTIASGGTSTDPANRLAGETATEANARITAGYKEMLAQPILSDAAKAAGATVEFVRTGAGGVGSYTVVTPAGYTGPKITTTEWTAGIIPSNSPYTTGTTLGVMSDGKGGYTTVTGAPVKTTSATGSSTGNTGSNNGNGKTIVKRVQNPDGSYTVTYSDGTTGIEPGMLGGGNNGSNTGTSNPPKDNTPSQTAQDSIRNFLNDAGLGNLAGKVWSQWTSGQSADQIIDWIRQQPEYAQRFPGMAALRKDGRSISEAQYVAKEQADIDLMTQYGIPKAFAENKDLLGKLIANNVSQVTLQKRLIAGQDTIMGYDKSILDYAKKIYGLSAGDLLAWSLNPDIALPVIEQQAQAMRIGGAATTAGYERGLGEGGVLGKTQAEALATQGITQQAAQEKFTQLAQMGQLEQQLPGDVSGALTSQEMIDAIFGISGGAQEKFQKVKSTRVGEFQQGGGFATSQAGITGIGQAPQV